MLPEQALFLQDCAAAASAVILFYDHIITFADELRLVWFRMSGKSLWLFLLNRYLAFAAYIPIAVLIWVPLSQAGCSRFLVVRQGLLVLSALVISFILAARTYALYGCSKKILALLVSTSVVGLIISCGSLAMQPWDRPSTTFLGCHTSTSASSGVHIAVPWECLLTFDTMLIVLTLARGRLLAPREMWVGPGAPRDIRAVITRDGVLYYAVVAGANAANVLTFYLAPAVLRGVLSNPASALSTVLCARLMLNIRAASDVAHPALPFTSAESTTGFDSRAAFTSRFALDEGPALDMEAARTSSKDAGSSLRQSSTWRSERERIELREMGPKCIPITDH